MYPHERSLVKRLEGKPFALLGVNSDPKERLKQVLVKEKITWRSWWDGGSTGGPIATKWAVEGWPTIYVLDAKGTANRGITLGQGVFLGRGTILSCKDGDITLGDHVNIGFHSEIFSGSSVTVGRHGLFAAYTYLVGGGHEFERGDLAVLEQPRSSRGITSTFNRASYRRSHDTSRLRCASEGSPLS